MTNGEIRLKIDAINARIKELVNPAAFVLNKEVNELLHQNEELQKQCHHEYKNGFCVWCDKKEEK